MAIQQFRSQFGDTTFTKVFVGGLAWETQNETMRRYFQQFGDILEAVVITDKNTGRSKGYGFVTFRDPDSARRACFNPNPVIDGRRANCNIASLGRPRPGPHYGRNQLESPYRGAPQRPTSYIRASPPPPPPPPPFPPPQSTPYVHQQSILYSPYGYTSYAPDYAHHQHPQQYYYHHMYGAPASTVNLTHPYTHQVGYPLHGRTTVTGGQALRLQRPPSNFYSPVHGESSMPPHHSHQIHLSGQVSPPDSESDQHLPPKSSVTGTTGN